MPTKLEILEEAHNRGILKGRHLDVYNEAVKRGLIGGRAGASKDEFMGIPEKKFTVGRDPRAGLVSGRRPEGGEVTLTPEQLKGVAKTGIEAVGTTLGAAGGAMVPVPGGTAAGAGLGYAASKRAGEALMGESPDMSTGGMAIDFALGAAFQSLGSGLNKLFKAGKSVAGKVSKSVMEKAVKVPPSGKIGWHNVDRETVINTMLDRNIPVSKGGLNRTRGLLDGLLGKMDDAVLQNPDAPISTDSVLGPVREFQAWASQTVNGSKYAKKIDGVINTFKKQYGDEITIQQAQQIKQTTNAFIRKSYGELKPVVEEAQKQIVRGLKDKIAKEVPEITGINLEYKELKQVELALERAVARTGNWDWLNFSSGMVGMAVGGTTGKVARAAEAAATYRVFKNPWVQSQLAIALKKSGAGLQSSAMANAIVISAYKKAKDILKEGEQ